MSPTSRRIAVVAAITLAALWLRLSAIGWMLPYVLEQDTIVFSTQVDRIESGVPHPEEHPKFGFYPLLVARLTVLAFDPAPTEPPPRDLAEMLRRASAMLLHIRIVVAILSVLVVPATFLLARRFLPDGAAYVAAALMAASVLHLWFSQQARPHAAAAGFGLLAVLAALELRRKGRMVDYLLAGIALAFAVGSLQSGAVTMLSMVAAVCLREREAARASRWWSLATIAITALGVWYFYPYLFVQSHGKDAAQLGLKGPVLNLSGHLIFLEQFTGGGWIRVARALWGYEPWLTLLAIVGAALAIASLLRAPASLSGSKLSSSISSRSQRIKDLVVVLAFAIPYLVAIGMYGRTYQRFAIPLLPYLCCLAAYAVWRASSAFRPAFAAVPVVLLVGPQVFVAAKLIAIRSAPDTAMRAADWLTANLRPGADRILLLPTFELPLAVTGSALEGAARPWFAYQKSLPPEERPGPAWNLVEMPMGDAQRLNVQRDPVGYLRGLDGDYAVIEVAGKDRRPPALGAIGAGLAQIGERVARITPDPEDSREDLPLHYQDDEFPRACAWAWRVVRAHCTGPVIEIWKIRKDR